MPSSTCARAAAMSFDAALPGRDLAHGVVVDIDRAGAACALERGREHSFGLGVEVARVFRERAMHLEI